MLVFLSRQVRGHLLQQPRETDTTPILQAKKLRCKEQISLAQGHPGGQWDTRS